MLKSSRIVRGVSRLMWLYASWFFGPTLFAVIANLGKEPLSYENGYYWLNGFAWIALICAVIAIQWNHLCAHSSRLRKLFSALILWLALNSLSVMYLLMISQRTVSHEEEIAFPVISSHIDLKEWFGNQTELFAKTLDSLTALVGFRTLPLFPDLSLRQEWMFEDLKLHLVFIICFLLLIFTFWMIYRIGFKFFVLNKQVSDEKINVYYFYWFLPILGGVIAYFPLRWTGLNSAEKALDVHRSIGNTVCIELDCLFTLACVLFSCPARG